MFTQISSQIVGADMYVDTLSKAMLNEGPISEFLDQ